MLTRSLVLAWVLATSVAGCGAADPEDDRPPALSLEVRAADADADAGAVGDAAPLGSPGGEDASPTAPPIRACGPLPATGCPCQDGAEPVSCDVDTDTTVPPNVPCWLGQRTCLNGVWTRCIPWRQRFQ